MTISTTADSEDLILQPRVVNGDDPYALFTTDDGKKPAKDDEKKIKALQTRLVKLGITRIKEPQIDFALRAKFADGDPEKAYEFLVLLEDSIEGIVREYDLSIRPLGAVNREKVTCWLDALLFAMFARLESFESILFTPFADEPRKRLAMLLRLWVNLLRTGKLITTDITKLIQEALANCGWPDAAEIHQQDVTEAFAFITEQLELPRLTLKMDIYHTGKEDATDDHKLVNERLLQVSIPSELVEGRVITLEDCLESYFNNRVEVRRHLDRKGVPPSLYSSDSISGTTFHADAVSISTPPASPVRSPPGPLRNAFGALETRARSPSIIRDRFVDPDPDPTPTDGEPKGTVEVPPRRRRRSTLRKEVLMPAWQFFSLIPWYTDRAPTTDAQVAAHFSSKRPVLGLCLKRYYMLPDGRAARLNTYVDIPLEIRLPHFIRDDNADEDGDGPLFSNFKLSLQSVVCHRGVSVDAGHYVALVRSGPADVAAGNGNGNSNGNGNGTSPRPNTASTASEHESTDEWVRFDDLARERVTPVDIRKALKEESPYLLFYQVQPVDEASTWRQQASSPPPPYSASAPAESNGAVSLPSSTTTAAAVVGYPAPAASSVESTTSAELSRTSDTHPRVSTSSERPASSLGPRPEGEGELNGSAEPSSSSRARHSTGRPGLWRGLSGGDLKGLGSSSSNKTSTEEGRLSSTLSRLTARISRDRLRANEGGPAPTTTTTVGADLVMTSINMDAPAAAAAAAPTAEDKAKHSNGNSNSSSKRFKSRGKSKGHVDLSEDVSRPTSGRSPERECRVM
ncbi:MAG: ATP binding [Watsoniomyces obsoletus]|nr:MAG: ATP binding [Watsoniomyces obsoletus]